MKKLSPEEKKLKVLKELKIDKNTSINPETKQRLTNLVCEFLDVFSENKFNLGEADLLEAEINLDNGDQPIVEPYRRPPVHLLPMVAKEIENLLEAGVIRESQSPFNTATVIVKKPDGSVRLCIDYRSLNKHAISVTAPLPPLDMITSQVGGKKFYSKMDLTKGYYAIRIREDHSNKTAWSIPGLGTYEVIRLPLGLKNIPSYFCQLLSRLFRGLDHNKCFVYLDDILTSSDDMDDMLNRLRLIFQRLRAGKLKLSPGKYEFISTKIMLLGSWISEKGYEADQNKVNAILQLSFSHTKKKLQSFLGASNWFRSLIRNYASLCSPLTDLLKTDGPKVIPTTASETAFSKVKEALSSMDVMILPDLSQQFIIYCDASFTGLGAAIGHEMEGPGGKVCFRPIAYASRVLTGPEKKWPSFKLEMKCIHYALNKWEHFVCRSPLKAIVYTDMLALTAPKYLNKTNCRLLLSWAMKLSEFKFELRHIKGTDNQLADLLSRAPTGSNDIWDHWVSVIRTQEKMPETINIIKEVLLAAPVGATDRVSTTAPKVAPQENYQNPLPITIRNYADILTKQLSDGPLLEVRKWLLRGIRPTSGEASGFDVTTRCYYNKFKRLMISGDNLVVIKYWGESSQNFRQLVCIPDEYMMLTIRLQHDKNGHPGIEKTMKMLLQTVWWPGQREQVTLHIRSCEQCFFFNEGYRTKLKAPLRVYDQRNICNSRCYCDTMGPIFMNSRAEKHILFITCDFFKYVSGTVLPDLQSSTIARGMLQSHILIHGCPEQLIMDQDSFINASKVIQELYDVLNKDKIQTSSS